MQLTKGADGVWTGTTGLLEPNIYGYAFQVDGVRATDPSCKCNLTWSRRGSESEFTIPGTPPQAWEQQGRPAGTLHREQFFSRRQQLARKFVVYTPPGYESSGNRRYPALLLFPGTPGDEWDWTTGGGFADTMFDNLIADGKTVPMIVVMHASDVLDPPDLRRSDENLQAFDTVITRELIPAIKARYRVTADPRMWAVAGISLGAEFGTHTALKHPDLFRTVVSMSGSFVARASDVAPSFEVRFPLPDPKMVARDYRLIWIGSGTEDIWFNGTKAFSERLTAAGIPHVYREYPGTHAMPVFRQELNDVLPRLFR
jgi:enterochelin esterase family protein